MCPATLQDGGLTDGPRSCKTPPAHEGTGDDHERGKQSLENNAEACVAPIGLPGLCQHEMTISKDGGVPAVWLYPRLSCRARPARDLFFDS